MQPDSGNGIFFILNAVRQIGFGCLRSVTWQQIQGVHRIPESHTPNNERYPLECTFPLPPMSVLPITHPSHLRRCRSYLLHTQANWPNRLRRRLVLSVKSFNSLGSKFRACIGFQEATRRTTEGTHWNALFRQCWSTNNTHKPTGPTAYAAGWCHHHRRSTRKAPAIK